MEEPKKKPAAKKPAAKKAPAKKPVVKKPEPIVRTVNVANTTSTQPIMNVVNYPKVTTTSTSAQVKSINITITYGD